VIGCNILPARVLRPTDKAACEHAFGVIRQLLFEHLTGYTGVDIADRGADPAADTALTMDEMEYLIATWIVAVWQRRQLGEYAPAWDPDGAHSPNSLFAVSFAQAGFAMQIPSPDLFYELLPAHYISRITRRGVKIRGLWYDGPVLDGYRGTVSSRGGRHQGEWVIRRDPRDRRSVFFQDPVTHAWHELPWTGLPPGGQAPAFGDARARDLLRKAVACGLRPKSDSELLPVLLELIGARIPVSRWPTQMAKAERTGHAREAARAQAARADRPSPDPADEADAGRRAGEATVTRCAASPDGPSGPSRPATALMPNAAAGGKRPSRSPRSRLPSWAQASGIATCSCSPRTARSRRSDGPAAGRREPGRPVPAGRAAARPDPVGGLAAVAGDPRVVHPGPAAVSGRVPGAQPPLPGAARPAPHRDSREPPAAGNPDEQEGVGPDARTAAEQRG
jgi:hypothetical protein